MAGHDSVQVLEEGVERSEAAPSDVGKSNVPPPSPIALLDPLQELCPSLDAVQALCARSEGSLPGGETFRRQTLLKAFLKAASSGDTELLGWMCFMHSQREREDVKEAVPFRSLHPNDARDDEGTGPLVLAASSGHVEAVRLLVRYDFGVDERDALGWTPLMWAINNVNLPLVSFLLSQGADSHVKSYKGTTCEDFILSSDTSYDNSHDHPVKTDDATPSVSQDRQLIGELIYEYQRSSDNTEKSDANIVSSKLDRLNIAGRSEEMSSFGVSSPSPKEMKARQHSRTNSSSARKLMGHHERTQLRESELRQRELAEGRRRALLDVAVLLQVEYQDLVGEAPSEESDAVKRPPRRGKSKYKASHSGLASGCGAIEVGADPLSNDFDFDKVHADQMLVVGEVQIASVIDFLINKARPLRAPWTHRSRPANVIYLCSRFAARSQDEGLQEELLFAYISAVEAILYARPTELTHLAFWLYNTILLLHYLQVDTTLCRTPAISEHMGLLSELINEIFIFIVRDIERRIDKILQVAILDHESIPPLEDLRYEDEWSFLKTIRGSVKGIGGISSSPGTPSSSLRRPLSQMFARDADPARNSPRQDSKKPESRPVPSTPATPTPFPSPPPSKISSPSKQRLETGSGATSVSDLLSKPSPRTITALLTSVLHVLQLYEINPCVIVQAFSQVFFWVGCEVFNRILAHKRYVCKNKAMQIRLNVSALEGWIKTNALPSSLIQVHFERANQLAGWILCQSSLRDFDALIATMQGFRSLTPAQLKHVVSEYRYEVGESRMNADCVQYLDQLQVDWLRQRQETSASDEQTKHSISHSRSATLTQANQQNARQSELSVEEDDEMRSDEEENEVMGNAMSSNRALDQAQRDIDLLFAPGRTLNDFVPRVPDGDETMHKTDPAEKMPIDAILLNSRDMLPFVLPSSAGALIVSPGDAFGFGRGHFMGTGTPSLKSMRTPSLLPSPRSRSPLPTNGSTSQSRMHEEQSSSTISSASLASSSPLKYRGTTTPTPMGNVQGSLLAAPGSQKGLGIVNLKASGSVTETGRDVDTASQRSSVATATSLASSSTSALFPQGKGLAAGSSWQPVPLLPDGTLEVLSEVMRL